MPTAKDPSLQHKPDHSRGAPLFIRARSLALTDRDIVVRVLAEGSDPATGRVGEICSRELTTILPTAGVGEAVRLIREKAVRPPRAAPLKEADQMAVYSAFQSQLRSVSFRRASSRRIPSTHARRSWPFALRRPSASFLGARGGP